MLCVSFTFPCTMFEEPKAQWGTGMADLEIGYRQSDLDEEDLRDGLEELEEVRRQRRQFFTKAFFGLLGLAALGALVMFFPTINRRAAGGMTEGQEAIVSRASIAGVEFDAWTEVAALEDVDNQTALNQLVGTGRAFIVNEGSELLVIEVRFNSVMVRALNGTNAGKEGWLRSGSLRVN